MTTVVQPCFWSAAPLHRRPKPVVKTPTVCESNRWFIIRSMAHDWTPEEDALLGTATDRAIAAHVGVPPEEVRARRRALGIAAYSPHRPDATLIAVDGTKIRARREALGLTRFALAGRDTALAAHLGMLEKGTVRRVTLKTLRRLCALLQCAPTDSLSI